MLIDGIEKILEAKQDAYILEEAYSKSIKDQYKELYKNLYIDALNNEKNNSAKKPIIEESKKSNKTKNERKDILDKVKQQGMSAEVAALLYSCSLEDMKWIKNNYTKESVLPSELNKQIAKRDSLKKKIKNLVNNQNTSVKNQEKIDAFNEELMPLSREIDANEDYISYNEIYEELKEKYEAMKDDYDIKLNAVKTGTSNSIGSFEAMMKCIWNNTIKEKIYSDVPSFGGLNEQDANEIHDMFYESIFDKQKRTGKVSSFKKTVSDANERFKAYTTGTDVVTNSRNLILNMASYYAGIKINFNNRNIFSKIFHLNEYFTYKKILNKLVTLLPEGEKNATTADKLLFEEANSLKQTEASKTFTDATTNLKNAINENIDVEAMEYENKIKAIDNFDLENDEMDNNKELFNDAVVIENQNVKNMD